MTELIRVLKMFPRWLKWRWQRSGRGWADCDVWDADKYLATVIQHVVAEILWKRRHAYPISDAKTTESELNEIVVGMMAVRMKKEYMDAFLDSAVPGPPCAVAAKERVRLDQLQDRAFDLLKKHFDSLWD